MRVTKVTNFRQPMLKLKHILAYMIYFLNHTFKKIVGWSVVLRCLTFNNISVISWWSVLLMEETGVPGENHKLQLVTDKLYHMLY
jgi:hypothetical protein